MLNNLQLDIHYTFKQVKRLEVALTHSSFVNESPERGEHNERLEFLGDAVLELCISEILFCAFPQAREGELTSMRSALVSQPSLAGLARSFKLDQYLLLGRGEEAQGGRKRDALLSDALEALLGAVFIDGSFAQVKAVVEILFASLLQRLQSERDNARSGIAGVFGSSDGNGGMSGAGPGTMNVAGKGAGSWAGNRDKDAKSRLQEMTQRLYQERPVYHLVGSDGPEHAKFFRVSLTLPDGRLFEAAGSSLKRAEQAVAAKALAELEG